MIKEYSQNRSNVIMNFSVKYCDSPQELFQSNGFRKVLKKYVVKLEKRDELLLEKIKNITKGEDVTKTLLELFKLLVVLKKDEIRKLNAYYKALLKSEDVLIGFIEGFYDYWRRLERYALIQSSEQSSGIQSVNFVEANNSFSETVITAYRMIEENILGYKHNIYRQLNAGINAGIVLINNPNILPTIYSEYEDIKVIKSIVLNPPLIIYPKRNTRDGIFEEVFLNPIKDLNIKSSHYFCYPAKVGDSLVFVYFHRDFMNQGVSLCNLFELANREEYETKSPDIIYVYGARLESKTKSTVFYKDFDNDMYIGLVNNSEEIDYFGYMKKMILTLHNLRMLEKDYLPIHGAMVNVTMKNGKSANIAIMGDSGAGKSETLEAFRKLSNKYLKEIVIIFDDMGTFKIEHNRIVGYGTEIGAFVRLDDLDSGYAFKAMDRAIFMNPHKVNSRLLIPVATYKEIMKGYKVDMFLYANNYENKSNTLEIFDSASEAKEVFTKGFRKAKGTTTEIGVVESFFANPFGPVQKRTKTLELIDETFKVLFKNKVTVGQVYTKLGIEGYEIKGPEKAAISIFDWLKNK